MIDKNEIIFRPIKRSDISHLRLKSFPFGLELFHPSLLKSLLKLIKFSINETNIVAYYAKEKKAIGFLQLVSHTKSLYSIRYVYTNPDFRRRGIASGLIDYALSLAKRKKVIKVFLTAEYPYSIASKYYTKLGFDPLANTSIIYSTGFPQKKLKVNKTALNKINFHTEISKDLLFSTYTRCLGQKWVNFFKTTKENLINGFSQDFRHIYMKTVLVNESKNAFFLVFHYPFHKTAIIELYSLVNSDILNLLRDLFVFLKKARITYTKITIFNTNEKLLQREEFQLFKEEMDIASTLRFMGKIL